jgi:hypothetical protein
MFYVYFLGTNNGKWINAETMKDAKWIYALENGLNSITYIGAKKQTAVFKSN